MSTDIMERFFRDIFVCDGGSFLGIYKGGPSQHTCSLLRDGASEMAEC